MPNEISLKSVTQKGNDYKGMGSDNYIINFIIS